MQDNSVVIALRELQSMEAQRLVDEEERLARAAAEAEAARTAQAAAEARAAEAEAAEARRARVAETEARTAEANLRIARLTAEIEAVRTDRARIHEQVLAAASHSAPPSRGHRGWIIATLLACGAASALGWQLLHREPVVVERIVELHATPSTYDSPVGPSTPAEATVPEASESRQVEITNDSPASKPSRPARPARPPRPRGRTDMDTNDPFANLQCAADDPTCGAL